MTNEDLYRYDIYLDKLFCSEKQLVDIGKMAPAYFRQPRWEECFAIAFLRRFSDYSDIVLHDVQTKDANSLDLWCSVSQVGVEVTQAINDAFRKEEALWNKPLCNGISNDVVHYWVNQPTSMLRIKQVICQKIEKYQAYMKQYSPSDIDLFIYVVDARIVVSNQCFLMGYPVPTGMGYKPFEDFGFGLQYLLFGLNSPYRRIFIVFNNYWYKYELGHIQNCIMSKDVLQGLFNTTLELQERLGCDDA